MKNEPFGRIAAIAAIAAIPVIVSTAMVAAPVEGTAQLRVGQGVSIEVREAVGGQILADEVELLPDERSLSIRAPIQRVDFESGLIWILDLELTLDSARTEIDGGLPGTGFGALVEGRQVEAKVRSREGDLLAREIQTIDVKPSLKIKGTVSAILPALAKAYFAEIEHLQVLILRSTDFVQEGEDPILGDLFGEQKSDELLGDDPDYRLRFGDGFFVSGSVRSSGRFEDSYSLDKGAEDRVGIGEPSFRLEALRVLSRSARLFAQVTSRSSYDLFRSDDASADPRTGGTETRLRQLYVAWQDIGGAPVGLVVGKQRVRDPREFLFDEYLDGVRLYVYPLRPVVLEATALFPVVPLKDRFKTWTDLLLQSRLYAGDDVQARAYVLQRFDSDTERGRDVRYLGLAVDGERGPLKAWAEGTVLRGEDKGRRQEGTAWDAGVSLRTRRLPFAPSITAAVARGSGESAGQDTSHGEFRQTGYQDNSTRLWGIASFKRFGEALDPELVNLRVQTLGLGLRPHDRFSIDVFAHRYRQDVLSDELGHVDVWAPEGTLSGTDRELGYAADLVIGVGNLLGGLDLSYRLGSFLPGAAFAVDASPAFVHRVELRLDF